MTNRPTQLGVTVGSTQFTFSNQPADALSRRVTARPLPQERTEPRNNPGRRSWRPTNGELVQSGALAVIVVGILVGSTLAPIALVLFVLVAGWHRWLQHSRAANTAPTGLSRYLRDVDNAIKEVDRAAWSNGRGNLSTWQTVKQALWRAWRTVCGHGDMGRCSNGKKYCATCPNCTAGKEWD